MWVFWVLGGLALWSVLALAVGVLIGRGIRLADIRESGARPGVLLVDNIVDVEGIATAAREPRRAIPLPTVGVALAALGVALEGAGFLLRLTGATGTLAHVLSMDAPASLPRMYVTALFGAAGVVGIAGAGAFPGRRTWWTGVALVAMGIATVKAAGTWHAAAFGWLADRTGTVTAVLISTALAVSVVGGLAFLSRTERRDRRRVLGSLIGYAVAAVGLSAVSQLAGSLGNQWSTGATFLEESGEALAGVAFLVAVLAGVVPRAVLPAGWPLRRAADAQVLEIPGSARTRLPGTAGD